MEVTSAHVAQDIYALLQTLWYSSRVRRMAGSRTSFRISYSLHTYQSCSSCTTEWSSFAQQFKGMMHSHSSKATKIRRMPSNHIARDFELVSLSERQSILNGTLGSQVSGIFPWQSQSKYVFCMRKG